MSQADAPLSPSNAARQAATDAMLAGAGLDAALEAAYAVDFPAPSSPGAAAEEPTDETDGLIQRLRESAVAMDDGRVAGRGVIFSHAEAGHIMRDLEDAASALSVALRSAAPVAAPDPAIVHMFELSPASGHGNYWVSCRNCSVSGVGYAAVAAPPEAIRLSDALAAVDAEEELPGEPPPEMLAALRVSDTAALVEALRIAVRLTKHNIATRLRAAVAAPGAGEATPGPNPFDEFYRLVTTGKVAEAFNFACNVGRAEGRVYG
jgi:hypothetical protein